MTSERQRRSSERRKEFHGGRIRSARSDEDLAKVAWMTLCAYMAKLPPDRRAVMWRRVAADMARLANAVTGREVHL